MKKKTKDRSQSKAKDTPTALADATNSSTRGVRGRGGFEGSRGGRGRGTDRGRGNSRGGRAGLPNGTRSSHIVKPEETPVADGSAGEPTVTTDTATAGWDSANTDSTNLDSSWEHISADVVPAAPATAPEQPKPSSKPDGTRSWASMFSKPAPAPAPPKAPRAAPSHDAPVEPSVTATSIPTTTDLVGLPPPPVSESSEIPKTPPGSDLISAEPTANITPSKDELTETNLEQVEDVSGPPPLATAASTVASTIDPQSVAGGGGSLHSSQPQSNSRPPLGGFATSAYKATGMPGMPARSASYQRKILEQQEAVVMPGKHAVDRAAVQFGSMGLNGTTEDVDVDSDREDAETRAQPPQHSPNAPRAALPPAPQQQAFPSQTQIDPLPTPRQAPGLPPRSQQSAMPPSQGMSGDPAAPSQNNQSLYNNRYGPQQELSAPTQKAYEPFGQQMQQSQQYDGYPASQAQAQPPQQVQSQPGAYSSAPNDMSSYYTSDNQRNAYQNNSYYGNYGQQPQQSAQDSTTSQQRGGSAFGTSTAEQSSQYPTSGAQPQPQNRYAQATETQASGNSTPNPSLTGQQQPTQPQPMLQQPAQGQTGGQHGPFPYGHPYHHYGSPYYSYMNQVSNHPYGRERPMFDDVRRYDDQYLTQNPQFGYGSGQGGYGGGPFGGAGAKQGMYGQPHQGYGMNPQTSYDQHSTSPANAATFGQQHSTSGRESAVTGGLGNYGRSGSAQPSDNPQQYSSSGGNNHGGVPDVFGRSSSGYQGQNSGLGSQLGQQGGNEDSLRNYGDASKVPGGAGGPSPALGQPGGRPGSAANIQGQSGLPPPQAQTQGQQGYGGYMGHQMHGQQGSQYGAGPGGVGAHHQYGGQNHQAGGYGGYGAGYGTSSYGNSNRGGWNAANYGH